MRTRVFKPEHRRVKGKAVGYPGRMASEVGPVTFVPEHGMTVFGEVHANLVTTARLQSHANAGRSVQPFLDTKMCDGRLRVVVLFVPALANGIPLQTLGGSQPA